jgi:hypothetical protein
VSADGDASAFVTAMRRWSSVTLDTREGLERQLASRVAFSEYQQRVLERAARPLGLEASRQPAANKSRIVVLGGTVTANHLRVELAAKLADTGIATEIVLVGAARLLQAWEAQAVSRLSPDFSTFDELTHLGWVGQRGFGGVIAPGASPRTWHLENASLPVTIVEARQNRPGTRANTLDCYRAVDQLGNPPSTLLVTSAIYQPYTFFLLAPHMSARVSTEVIGTRSRLPGDDALKAQLIGQEIHAGIQAAANAWDPQ